MRALAPWILTLSFTGCYVGGGDSVFTNPSDIAQRRAEGDLACSHVTVVEAGGGAYAASGCGHRVTYVCRFDDDNGRVCVREGEILDNGADPRPPRAIAGAPSGLYVRELAAVSPEVERCLARPEVLALDVVIDGSGMVRSIAGAVSTADEESCIEAALSRVVVRSVPGPATLGVSFPPRAPPPGVAPPSPGPNELGPWVDERIAENRDAILACVSRAVVAVRVQAGAGAVRWGLQGELSGTPEEECVSSVLPSTAPADADGTLIRVVR